MRNSGQFNDADYLFALGLIVGVGGFGFTLAALVRNDDVGEYLHLTAIAAIGLLVCAGVLALLLRKRGRRR